MANTVRAKVQPRHAIAREAGTTEDGWLPAPRIEPNSPLLVWRTVPGTNVNLQVRNDHAGTVMLAYAADYNAFVEPLRDADSACYTPTNSVNTSNHLNATAMDLNWDNHPFQTHGTFTAAQMTQLRDLLDYYSGIIFWAGDWTSPVDEMHHQMDYGSYGLETSGQLAQWIADHIRPDGFSTYRRGAPAPAPAPPPQPAVMTVPLTDNGDGTWTSPSPAWAHLIMRESSGNPTIIQQITDVNSGGNEAEGLFQITPRTWKAHGGQEFAPSARLATPQQQAIVAARIFTQNPTGSDWGAGLAGRENANQLAAGLVPVGGDNPTPGDDDMANWTPELVDRAMVLLENQTGVMRPSRSPFRHVGEGPVDTCGGFAWSADGNIHAGFVAQFAVEYGDPTSIALLWEVAKCTDPDRQQDAALAQRVLNKVNKADLDNADNQIAAWLAAQAKAKGTTK